MAEWIEVLREQNDPDGDFYVQIRPDFDLLEKRLPNKVELHRLWVEGVESNNLGDINRLYFLYMNVKAVVDRGIPGAFAELGVYKGNSAKLVHTVAPDRTLYLFDTFEGFEPSDMKSESFTGPAGGQFTDTSLDQVKRFIGESSPESANVIFCQGHFPDTAGVVPDFMTFAFVHLDCDLYEPMMAGLEYFYPRLAPGGLLVIHDYYSGRWPGVTRAVDEFFEDKPEILVHIPDKSGTAVVSKNREIKPASSAAGDE